MRDGVVDAALVVDVERGSDQIHERPPELAERTDGDLTVLDGPGVAADHGDGRPEVQLLADSRQTRDRAEPNDGAELVGRVGEDFAVEAQDVGGGPGGAKARAGRGGAARTGRSRRRRSSRRRPAAPRTGRGDPVRTPG